MPAELNFIISEAPAEHKRFSVESVVIAATYSGKLHKTFVAGYRSVLVQKAVERDASGDTDVERFLLSVHWYFY